MAAPHAVPCAQCGARVVVVIVLRHEGEEWSICLRCYYEPMAGARAKG